MKRALSFIAATVVTTSVYSQPYTGSSSSTDALMEQARQRIYESPLSSSGAPAPSQSDSSSGFERSAGSSNSSTGQSNGSNLNSGASATDQTSVTTDSDISGLEDPHSKPGNSTTGVEGSVQSDSLKSSSGAKNSSEENVGAPGEVQSGASSSSTSSTSRFDNPDNSGAARDNLSTREDRFLNGESKKMDFYGALNSPDLEGDYVKSLDEDSDVRISNGTDYWQQQSVGAPAGAQTGTVSSGEEKGMKKDCDTDKAHHSQTSTDVSKSSDDGTVRSSGTAIDADERYRINREQGNDQAEYHVNREAGSPSTPEASGSAATSETGTRSSGTAIDSDERARMEREKQSANDSESKSGVTPSSGTAADSDEKAHPDL